MKPLITLLIAFSCLPLLHAEEKPAEATATPEKKNPALLFTKKYTVPATFFRWLKQGPATPSSDPFATPAQKGEGKQVTPKEKFASMGIITGEDGASVVFNEATATLVLRGTEKHHQILTAALENFSYNSERQLHVIVEFIEVEHLDFSDWLLDNRLSGDATELRKEVQEWLHDKRGTILETSMITARSGQRAKTESGDEYIYPTEISPPSMPGTLTLGEEAQLPESSPYPSAFETRNLGITLEVDPVLGADGTTIDLNLSPEMIKLSGQSEWFSENTPDAMKISMPTFHRMKVTTQVTLLDGRYVLAGSCRPMPEEKSKRDDPMVLLFIRADIGHLGKWSVEDEEAE
ncbi:MAG: hypothetical protein P1U86_16350 [Verrucomicrobiales bacterium]|nr:hypothetical protein [Verrucomicrobiales bacterium]